MSSQFAALESGAPGLSVTGAGGVAWVRERWAALSLSAVALLSATWAVFALAWPMGFDHGLYTWTGDVVIQGGLPYRDSWDMHGPLVPYLFALPQAVFGPRFWGVRVLDLLILGASLYALYRLLATVSSRTAAMWAVAVFPLCYASTGFNETAQPDGWVGLALMAAVVPLLVRTPGTATVFAAGLVVGAAALVKPVFAAFLLVPFVCLFNGGRPTLKALAGRTVVMGVGFVIPIAAAAAWFASKGGLGYLVEVHLAYTSQVYSPLASLDLQGRMRGLLDYVWSARVVAVAQPAVLLGAFALRRSHPGVFRALVTWVVLGIALVLLQNKYYMYHWHIILPPLAALAAAGLHAALSPARAASRDARLLAIALMGVIVVHAASRPGLRLLDDLRFAVGALDKQAYTARFRSDTFEPAAIREVGTYIRGRTTQADRLAIYGFDAGILYESGRESAFRMAGWSWPVTEGEGSPIREEYRREYLESMERTRPTYVVVNRGAGNEETSPTLLPPTLSGFPELASVIQSRYRYERHFGRYTLYRRADAAPR
ncbi:MAG TPA: hypothetical protein VF613_26120 [Longimicrobium sp.]|jgi:hypothetical protein